MSMRHIEIDLAENGKAFSGPFPRSMPFVEMELRYDLGNMGLDFPYKERKHGLDRMTFPFSSYGQGTTRLFTLKDCGQRNVIEDGGGLVNVFRMRYIQIIMQDGTATDLFVPLPDSTGIATIVESANKIAYLHQYWWNEDEVPSMLPSLPIMTRLERNQMLKCIQKELQYKEKMTRRQARLEAYYRWSDGLQKRMDEYYDLRHAYTARLSSQYESEWQQYKIALIHRYERSE